MGSSVAATILKEAYGSAHRIGLTGAHSAATVCIMPAIISPEHLLYGSDYLYVAPQVLGQNLLRAKDYLSKETNLAPFRELMHTNNVRRLFDNPINSLILVISI